MKLRGIIYIALAGLLTVLSSAGYAQALLESTITQMEISQEIQNAESRANVAPGKVLEEIDTNSPKPAAEPKPFEPKQQEKNMFVEDANQSDIDINDFNDFERELKRIDIETRSEQKEWLGELDRKEDLAKAIDDLAAAELRFIRKLANLEGAEKTIKAIDLVLKQRRERLETLVTKLQEELKEQRLQNTPERRERRAPRAERTRERPTRRTREPRVEEPAE